MMDEVRFASLLCSRLCHDLVSPVGALANGVEILADDDDPEMVSQVIDLLGQSAEQTSARLQFFRLAFGSAGGFGAELDPREAEKVIRALFADTRINVIWDVPAQALAKDATKILLNLALILGEGLVRGGDLEIRVTQENGRTDIEVAATADRVIIQDSIIAALDGRADEADIEPRTAPAYLCVKLVEALNGSISISSDDQTGSRFCVSLAS